MTHETNLPGVTHELGRTLAEFTRALEAMREDGWLAIAPATTTFDVDGSHAPAIGVPEAQTSRLATPCPETP